MPDPTFQAKEVRRKPIIYKATLNILIDNVYPTDKIWAIIENSQAIQDESSFNLKESLLQNLFKNVKGHLAAQPQEKLNLALC